MYGRRSRLQCCNREFYGAGSRPLLGPGRRRWPSWLERAAKRECFLDGPGPGRSWAAARGRSRESDTPLLFWPGSLYCGAMQEAFNKSKQTKTAASSSSFAPFLLPENGEGHPRQTQRDFEHVSIRCALSQDWGIQNASNVRHLCHSRQLSTRLTPPVFSQLPARRPIWRGT